MGFSGYWMMSGGRDRNFKKGDRDGQDGLPKCSDTGDVLIPPHLGIIKNLYEGAMSEEVTRWVVKDGNMLTSWCKLKSRKTFYEKTQSEKQTGLFVKYLISILLLALLEMPITFIALESIFKENLILTALTCIGFSALIVGVGHLIGGRLYREELLRYRSVTTVLIILVTFCLIVGLSYLRYVYQVEQISREKQDVVVQAEVDETKGSSALSEKIRGIDAKNPLAISVVFLFMSAGFTLWATHNSTVHYRNRRDNDFIVNMKQYLDERMTEIQKRRETLLRKYQGRMEQLHQKAQREFDEYMDGLCRNTSVKGGTLNSLRQVISQKFTVEISEKLKNKFPDSVDDLKTTCSSEPGQARAMAQSETKTS